MNNHPNSSAPDPMDPKGNQTFARYVVIGLMATFVIAVLAALFMPNTVSASQISLSETVKVTAQSIAVFVASLALLALIFYGKPALEVAIGIKRVVTQAFRSFFTYFGMLKK